MHLVYADKRYVEHLLRELIKEHQLGEDEAAHLGWHGNMAGEGPDLARGEPMRHGTRQVHAEGGPGGGALDCGKGVPAGPKGAP